jgi:hypothetical protein
MTSLRPGVEGWRDARVLSHTPSSAYLTRTLALKPMSAPPSRPSDLRQKPTGCISRVRLAKRELLSFFPCRLRLPAPRPLFLTCFPAAFAPDLPDA